MNHGYIRVTNWTKFQHYRDRKPPWVKFYTELLHPSNRLNDLPVPTRFLFDRLLLLAAEYDNLIPSDHELIAKQLRMRPEQVRKGLSELAKGKWISQTASRRQVANPERTRNESELTAQSTRNEAHSQALARSSQTKQTSGISASRAASKRASRPLAPETETETERSYGGGTSKSKTRCPLCTVERDDETGIVEHLENVHSVIVTSLADYRAAA